MFFWAQNVMEFIESWDQNYTAWRGTALFSMVSFNVCMKEWQYWHTTCSWTIGYILFTFHGFHFSTAFPGPFWTSCRIVFSVRAEICRRAAVSASVYRQNFCSPQKLGWSLRKLYLASVDSVDRWQYRFDNQLWQNIGIVRHIWNTCIYCFFWSKAMLLALKTQPFSSWKSAEESPRYRYRWQWHESHRKTDSNGPWRGGHSCAERGIVNGIWILGCFQK